ncbi:putative metalloprotease [Parabacteroides sp. PF5-5]|uniref:M48 family metallopeptidase n=1 Tax=unclassified Parabacteroides TaxID=2649774 RepID=UPI002472FE55|nr:MULTISPECIES: M48 family metallopeptidase [unclassified Parabacteroides]MDH6305684.1 putative metalloprotease [Parabacteroides sp. PH5-39]MDH6316756.1 putative metalloprotease [Parabacteroides sp. PF5-13]MDH6320397.1 putative metalloprotease [Parabacteroides sp. PH5-13]MDH6324127.1 putative metalloprotease [Parabacteroides sp. PH5-8]MDH6327942.1 putative metalloprotease [Parabacteroides sp. PH5-41]
MRTILLSLALIMGVCSGMDAQIKIGGRKIDTKKIVNAAEDVAKAVTLSDADIAALCSEYIEWMDANNPVAGPDTEMGARLERLTSNLKGIDGLNLNFKVYYVTDVNAFASGDGSIRVCGGLMELMDDSEVMAVIGHEIGHIASTDVKDAMKNAYLRSAAKNVVAATGSVAQSLTESQLGELADAFGDAQFSQKQEYAADDYALQFCVNNNFDPYGMANALSKLVSLSSGEKASTVQKMFSSHPDSEKRAKRMKEKADQY